MLGNLRKVGSLSEPQFINEKAIALPESLGPMDLKRSRVQTYGAISMLKPLKGHASGGTSRWGRSVRLPDRAGGTSLPAPAAPSFPTAQSIAAVVAEVPSSRILSLPSYVMPSCESDARAKSTEVDDPFKDRELPGGR